jgi:hypothetical protein
LVCCLLLIGCGGPHDAYVSGTVTVDGKKIDCGIVSFYPTGGGAAAYSDVFPDGSYRLKTGSRKGLAPGEYIVTIVAIRVGASESDELAAGERLTPERYARTETSDLRRTVKPGKNDIDLALTSQP